MGWAKKKRKKNTHWVCTWYTINININNWYYRKNGVMWTLFSTAVSLWGQSTHNLCSLSPKGDSSPKKAATPPMALLLIPSTSSVTQRSSSIMPLRRHFLYRSSTFWMWKKIERLTLLVPRSRFGDKLLIIRVFCPPIWDCGSKRVKRYREYQALLLYYYYYYYWQTPRLVLESEYGLF